MTDRSQMWDDISRALRSEPKPAKAPTPTNVHIFSAEVIFSSVFLPGERKHIFPERKVEDFAISFSVGELPLGVVQYTSPRDGQGKRICAVHARHAPTIIQRLEVGCTLATTIQCARASNIEPDRLLRGLRVDLAVEAVEFESRLPYIPPTRTTSGRNGSKIVRRLELLAVRVDANEMVTAYDRIMEEAKADFEAWYGRDE